MNNTKLQSSINGKRVAQNTIALYIRMFLVMVVSLYSVRVVLAVLGEEDYGIYNVVGGIVLMFSFLGRTLASASQRYFSYDLGKKDYEHLGNVFDITFILYMFFIVVICVIAESLGLWFLHNKMTIPDERMHAAELIFHFSVVSFIITIFATPYQALIIAHEKMNIYAAVGIVEAFLNLLFAVLLQFFGCDSLVLYGGLVMIGALITNGIYVAFSYQKYPECHFNHYWNLTLAREIVLYSGWNMYGAIANVIRSHGINILINVFFNPIINAARGLAFNINNAISSFASNFYTAVRPQLTKSYAEGNEQGVYILVDASSKLSYYLILVIAVPLIVFAEQILSLWLENVPKYTPLFMQLTIIVAMIDSISNPLMTLVQATGEVKKYQLIIGTLLLLNLPMSWILLKLGFFADVTMYVAIGIAVISLMARLRILRKLINFPVISFVKDTLLKMFLNSICCFILAFLVRMFLFKPNPDFLHLCFSVILIVVLTMILTFFIGFNKEEMAYIKSFSSNIIEKILRKR